MCDEPKEWFSPQIRPQNIEQNMCLMIHRIGRNYGLGNQAKLRSSSHHELKPEVRINLNKTFD